MHNSSQKFTVKATIFTYSVIPHISKHQQVNVIVWMGVKKLIILPCYFFKLHLHRLLLFNKARGRYISVIMSTLPMLKIILVYHFKQNFCFTFCSTLFYAHANYCKCNIQMICRLIEYNFCNTHKITNQISHHNNNY